MGHEPSVGVLAAVRTLPFWLLAGSYFVCGYSTSGLIDTHMVPYAIEHGVPSMAAASATIPCVEVRSVTGASH